MGRKWIKTKAVFASDLEDLKKFGWDYAKKWLEEVREEKYKWANAFHNLKRALEGNEA